MRPKLPLCLVFCIFLLQPVGLPAQATGTVAGQAVAAEDGAPIPYSLIHLLAAGGDAGPIGALLTDAQGRFRFTSVAPGSYRLRLARIGYESQPSPTLAVTAGEVVKHTLRSRTVPVQLEGLTVRPVRSCFTLAQLQDEAPDLAVLWREAQKGVETRAAFERQYRFTYDLHHEGVTDMRFGRDRTFSRDSTIVSRPDSVLARMQRRRADREGGYARERLRSFTLSVPDDRELLEDEFLVDHCLESEILPADGAIGLRFRPVSARSDRVDVAGVLWLEEDSFLVRGIDVTFLRGRSSMGESRILYADTAVPGGRIRLPWRTWIQARPGGGMRMVVAGFENSWERRNMRDIEIDAAQTGGDG